MIVALIDNGSLEPAALHNLRAVAGALSNQIGLKVHPVSWKHSDRIVADAGPSSTTAWTLAPFVRAMHAFGQREFVFVPFFISAQGAIGSALRGDLEKLQSILPGLEFRFTESLAECGALASIVTSRIRETLKSHAFRASPPVILVDHGGPSRASAELRDAVAAELTRKLSGEIGALAAASMEGEHLAHNRPSFADQLGSPGFDRDDVVIAPLFLSPGRHAGADGDLCRTAREKERRFASQALKAHFTGLVGTHPLAIDALAEALRDSLSHVHVQPFA